MGGSHSKIPAGALVDGALCRFQRATNGRACTLTINDAAFEATIEPQFAELPLRLSQDLGSESFLTPFF